MHGQQNIKPNLMLKHHTKLSSQCDFRENLLRDSATLLAVANEFLPPFSKFLCRFWLTSGPGNLHSMMLFEVISAVKDILYIKA